MMWFDISFMLVIYYDDKICIRMFCDFFLQGGKWLRSKYPRRALRVLRMEIEKIEELGNILDLIGFQSFLDSMDTNNNDIFLIQVVVELW